jgi:L-asparaginase/Glu-tRNA(Gln) amidotransferase subunit D
MFGGSDLSLYSVGRKITDKYHVLEAGKMTIELASMKAMWALAYSKDYDSFERLFFAEI